MQFGKRRSSRRSIWLTPVLILAAGGLYAALQLDNDDPGNLASPGAPVEQFARSIPLNLPPVYRSDGGEAKSEADEQSAAATPLYPPTESNQPPETGVVANSPPATSAPTANATSKRSTEPGHWLAHKIAEGDTLSRIFKGLGLSAGLLHKIVHSCETAKRLARIKPGQTIRIHLDDDDRLTELVHEIDPVRSLKISRSATGFNAELTEQPVENHINEVSGVIEISLFGSAQKAGLSDSMIMEMAGIFGWDIDFALELRTGDRFSVVFSEQWLDGKKLRDGPILAAEFVNQGKTYRALRFDDGKGFAGYYSPNGKSMRKTFLRAPVDFRRISSRFQKERWHPVLGKKRPHRGVDYAAAIGTPVKASGNGKVIFKGRKGGYGKTVILQHGSKYTTLYAHLNGYRRGMKNGHRVKQGDVIGYVGRTGLATGPHLHYEFRVDGVHHNPLTVKLPAAEPIAKHLLPAFKTAAEPLLARLDSLSRTMVADVIP